jgi:hypothetical protein
MNLYLREKIEQLDWNSTAVVFAASCVSIIASLLIIVSQGNLFMTILFIAGLLVVLITFYRLDLGFFIMVAMILLSDRYDIIGFRPFTYTIFYLSTINVINPAMSVGVLTSHEIQLIFIICVWIIIAAVTKRITFVEIPLKKITIFTILWILWSIVYGGMHGGDMQMALWEIRALPLIFIMFVLTPQFVRTKEQLTVLVWIMLVTLLFKAFQGIERFIRIDFSFGNFRTLTNSEDPLFFITLFILLLGFFVFNVYSTQRRALLLSFLPLLFGFYVGNRRATYASFTVAIIAFVFLLEKEYRRKISKYLLIFGVIFAVYLAAYWDSYGRMAMVARAFRSTIFAYDRNEQAGIDYASGLAREQENYNLAVTFRNAPILGIGFGKQHEWAIRNYGSFALKGYVTHNQILWFLIKSGVIGYFLFFLFLNGMAMYGGYLFVRLKDPYLKAVCAMAVTAIISQLVSLHVEQQLINSRTTSYLGLMIGLIPVVETIHNQLAGSGDSKIYTDS